jgi:hypothetical protein
MVSDSLAAFKTVTFPCRQSEQSISNTINETTRNIRDQGGPRIRLQWVPVHSAIAGNETADKLAKEAASGELRPFQGLTVNVAIKRAKEITGRNSTSMASTIDTALPEKHEHGQFFGPPPLPPVLQGCYCATMGI